MVVAAQDCSDSGVAARRRSREYVTKVSGDSRHSERLAGSVPGRRRGAGIKSREVSVEDEEKRRLKSVVAGLSVEAELLREKIALIEGGRPLVSWKSRT